MILFFFFYFENCCFSARYYADLEKKKCPESLGYTPSANASADHNACIVWRRFAKLVYELVGFGINVYNGIFILVYLRRPKHYFGLFLDWSIWTVSNWTASKYLRDSGECSCLARIRS